MKEENHYVLGFPARKSGAFEHAWGFAKNLKKRGHNAKYYSCWWDGYPKRINLETKRSRKISKNEIKNLNGIIHLQTHTWEYLGFLDEISCRGKNKMTYGLHAVIPYYYMSERDKYTFLRGELPRSSLDSLMNTLIKREKAQLSAMKKADYLITISKSHKKIIKLLNMQKPVYVFENVSDFYNIQEELIFEARMEAAKVRESLGKENILLYCGKLYPKKGSFGLFEAFGKITKEYPSSKLILLGVGDDAKKEMFSYGLNPNISDKVHFVPWIEKDNSKEFLKFFLASDVLIQPMITPELYSKSVVDAMALGIPAISCKSPYTVGSSENWEAIFRSFVRFKENPKEIKEITKRAKEKIRLENNWDSYLSRLEKILC